MLKVLDLFSGIGGFSLGLERTGGFETVAFCEIEKFPQKVLRKHWPEVPIYEDVRELTAERLEADGITGIDVITGGFPCQDISVGGSKAGITEDTRSGLWSEVHRLISEIQPRYAILENVSNLLAGPTEQPGGWFSRILGDLAEVGHDCMWGCIPASSINAPHVRDRIWVISYPSGIGQQEGCSEYLRKLIENNKSNKGTWNGRRVVEPRIQRVVDGIPDQLDRLKGLGNAVVPQIPELIGRAILDSQG